MIAAVGSEMSSKTAFARQVSNSTVPKSKRLNHHYQQQPPPPKNMQKWFSEMELNAFANEEPELPTDKPLYDHKIIDMVHTENNTKFESDEEE